MFGLPTSRLILELKNICAQTLSISQKKHIKIETTADVLFDTIKCLLTDLKIPVKNIIGVGMDGANNLCGQNNSVVTHLKKHSPNIILLKCVCHSLLLCVSDASNVFKNEVDFVVRETYNWFKNSPLRRSKYSEMYKLINSESSQNLNFVQLSTTRWLSRSTAVDRICNQYLELETFFEINAGKEKCYTAYLLHQAFKNKRNYLILLFLRSI